MPEVIQQILNTIGGFFDSPVVQLGLRAIGLYIAALWLASAYWAFRDMQLRTSNPILPYFAASLIILFTPVFFIFGVLTYRIVRPQEKIGETYERTLAEEALLAEVESVKGCPTCGRRVDDEWIICPTCRTRLNRVCPNCSRLVGLDWSLCAWCGRDFERLPSAEPVPTREPAQPRDAPREVPVRDTSSGGLARGGSPAAVAAVVAAAPVSTQVSRPPVSSAQSSSARLSSAPPAPAARPMSASPASGAGQGSSSAPASVKRPGGAPPAGRFGRPGTSSALPAGPDSPADA